MPKLCQVCVLLSISFFCFGQQVRKLDGQKVEIGSLHRANKATVVLFNSPECPICIKYSIGLKGLISRLDSLGIPTYMVYPGHLGNKREVKKFERLNKTGLLPNQILLDHNLLLTKHLKATVTPQAILLDSLGQVRYSGKLDNRFEAIGVERKHISERYLSAAVDEYLGGRPVSKPTTSPIGCLITGASD